MIEPVNFFVGERMAIPAIHGCDRPIRREFLPEKTYRGASRRINNTNRSARWQTTIGGHQEHKKRLLAETQRTRFPQNPDYATCVNPSF